MSRDWSGERLETFVLNNTTVEHLHRYAMIMAAVKDKTVLDIACGEGYGSCLLAENAKQVTGVDINAPTIEKAKQKYRKANLRFNVGSALQIPEDNNSFDVVVSFETLEHLSEHNIMLGEVKRVLKPEGIFIISTPDKKYYADEPGDKNPYHVKELYEGEFKLLMQQHFTNTAFLQQSFLCGSFIFPEESNQAFTMYSGDYGTLFCDSRPKPIYQIALASDGRLPQLNTSFYYNEEISKILANEKEALKNTVTYQVGHFLLRPFTFIRSILHDRF